MNANDGGTASPNKVIVPQGSAEEEYANSRQWVAFGVGCVALGLPIVMQVSSFVWNAAYASISHYYFTRFTGDVFVGALCFIGAFLLTYRGVTVAENVISKFAGFCAFGIAIFPTTGAGANKAMLFGRVFGEFETNDLGDIVVESVRYKANPSESLLGLLHYGSAALLFLVLCWFCFRVFTQERPSDRDAAGQLTPHKRRRNRIYYISGGVIALCLTLMVARLLFGEDWLWWDAHRLTFWVETAMLWAFGVSWLLKGRLGPFRRMGFGLWPKNQAAPAMTSLPTPGGTTL